MPTNQGPQAPLSLRPIGVIKNRALRGKVSRRDMVSRIVLDRAWEEGLEGLQDFSHVVVLFWMHRLPEAERSALWVHPRGRHDIPMVGVFAGRGPARPNPIGLTVVRLLELKGNVLKVAGLDALNGSPVIDIKPYMPGLDSVPEAQTPEWAR